VEHLVEGQKIQEANILYKYVVNILICLVHLLRPFENGKSFAQHSGVVAFIVFRFVGVFVLPSQLAGGINVTCITPESMQRGCKVSPSPLPSPFAANLFAPLLRKDSLCKNKNKMQLGKRVTNFMLLPRVTHAIFA